MRKSQRETAQQYTRRVLHNGGRARKSLGQNFLIDDQVIEKIVSQGIPGFKVPLIEIGPGPGALTRVLLQRTERLWAVEIDKAKVEILQKEFSGCPLILMHQDALKLNLTDIWGAEKGWLVGNLPYYITNPLLLHFLGQDESLLGMTVMVQKEVAGRMIAQPGGRDYGILSIAIQLAADTQILFDVAPSAFHPRPQVTSTVIRLEIRPYPGWEVDRGIFFQVVKAAFAQRRKTLLNSLSAGLNHTKKEISAILNFSGIDERLRAEELSIPDFQKIVKNLGSEQSREKLSAADNPLNFS